MESRIQHLNQLALDIEFLLISVIQGVALATLAAASLGPIDELQFEYWPYMVSGFLFVLIFWSGAINHALSFIKWPLDMGHSFLYFLASFVEVLVISNLTSPIRWFGLMLVFQIVAAILYWYDLGLIKKHIFEKSKQRLRAHVLEHHMKELKVFIPLSLVFDLVAVAAIYFNPELFINQKYHLIFISLQGVLGLLLLVGSVRSFEKRAEMIRSQVHK